MEGFLKLVFALIAMPVTDGFVIQQNWNWFMPDIFGLAPINIPMAIGINLVWHSISWRAGVQLQKYEERLVEQLTFWIVILGYGWVVHTYFWHLDISP